MKFDQRIGSIEEASVSAAVAESEGYDAVFTGEVNSDPFLPLVLAAEATEHILLGTSIAVAFARSPMTLAYTAYDLQRFSRGRFLLGLGSQVKAHVTRRFSMPWSAPAPRMREFILAMRAVWRAWSEEAPLEFEGAHYRHTLMTPTFVPQRHDFGPPAVFLAGVGEAMTAVAGEVADGLLCHAFTTDRWFREKTLPAVAQGLERANRPIAGFAISAPLFLATGTEAQISVGVEAIRRQVAFYGSTPAYRPVLELHGWGDLGADLTKLSKAGRWQEMTSIVDDEVMHTFGVVGLPNEVPALVAARCAGWVDRVSLLTADPLDAEILAAIRTATS
jgi:probable F420-dependent oxidoreductase